MSLQGVSDEPHNQDNQDTPEQGADHCTSNDSTSCFCTNTIFKYICEASVVFVFNMYFQNRREHTMSQLNSASWKSHCIWSIALVFPKFKLGYVFDFQCSSYGCWEAKACLFIKGWMLWYLVYCITKTQKLSTHLYPVQAFWPYCDLLWSMCMLGLGSRSRCGRSVWPGDPTPRRREWHSKGWRVSLLDRGGRTCECNIQFVEDVI